MKRNMISIFVAISVLLLLTPDRNLSGQSVNNPWSIGVSVGKANYKGDLGNGFFNFKQDYQGFVGLNLDRYLSKWFNLSAGMNYGRLGFKNETTDFLCAMTSLNLTVKIKLANGKLLSENARIAPYLLAGLGLVNYTPVRDRATKGTDLSFPFGAGANLAINEKISLYWQSSYFITSGDDVDIVNNDITPNNHPGNDALMMHKLGVKINLISKKDTDKDGISDKNDACPLHPGSPKMVGCPDKDKDGIIDRNDKCPLAPGLLTYHGCPDTDGDKIIDIEDKCPEIKGSALVKGCPDQDGDRIADDEDECPLIGGVKSNNGCPEISKHTRKTFREALSDVRFESGKAILKESAYTVLDKIVRIMNDNPVYKLSVEGHTDASGSADHNLTLSQNRSLSVMNYLIKRGADAAQLSYTGFGASRPVADNDTPEGRALNRRVEFMISF